MLDGIILIDKPAGWTSHDVVAKVRSALSKEAEHKVKVGHAGTLDPFATGLLILLIGKYTKQSDQFLKFDKSYKATLKLGATSSTGDPDGVITPVSNHQPSRQDVFGVVNKFIGQITQTPPAYSAIKIDGKRAYQLARKGLPVNIKPREVTIYDLKIISYEYPSLVIDCRVSSGTYIRSLAEDIGRELGCGAFLTELCRISIGEHELKEALNFDQLLTNDNICDTIIDRSITP